MNAALRPLPVLACAVMIILARPADATPGDLDFTFGVTGMVTTGSGPARGIALQADGKIVIAGRGTGGSSGWDFQIVRLHANGSLDPGFNGTGTIFADFGFGDDTANSVAIQSNGKIVVAGEAFFSGKTNFALVRYNSDGSPDTSFNGTGKAVTSFSPGSTDRANSVALQSDGKILAGGYSQSGATAVFALARYHADGSLDSTFGSGGMMTTTMGTSAGCYDIAVQSDSRIVAAGFSDSQIALVRYGSTGSLDGSFNGTGTVRTNLGFSAANAVAIQNDGGIVAAGYSNSIFAVLRYLPSGTLDNGFNGTGYRITSILPGQNAYGQDLALQDDGRIVVAGSVSGGASPPPAYAVVRYENDGTLDGSFGNGGIVTTSFGSGANGNGVVVQPTDGRIIVAGGGWDFAGVVRYTTEYPGPEIAVEQPELTHVADGGTGAFGAITPGSNASLTFTIRNIGSQDLTGVAVMLDGADVADFTVTATPAPVVVSGGGTTTFAVRFAPVTTGSKTAAMHITSNDPDENPFDIILTGLSVDATPDISVQQPAGTNISDGGTVPFDNQLPGTFADLTFLVRNSGLVNLSGLAAAIDGPDAGAFSITAHPQTVVGSGNSTSFTVRFTAAGLGARTAVLHLASNDPDENPFDITLTGAGVVAHAGLLDPNFRPVLNGNVFGIAPMADGRMMVAGTFSSVNGVARDSVARLYADGGVEDTPAVNLSDSGYVLSVVTQTDGKTLLGWAGANGLVRLNADSSLDSFFAPAGGTAPLALQSDGKILYGGPWQINRLLPNGTLDAGFHGGVDGEVKTVAVQADGKVLIGGSFATVNGQPRGGIARLYSNGTLEDMTTFNPGTGIGSFTGNMVRTIAVQPDGRILLGGWFSTVNGQSRNNIARLLPDGSLESMATFNPGSGATGPGYGVFSIALQTDGKILLGGEFTSVDGQPRNRIARLHPNGAVESLAGYTVGAGANSTVSAVMLQADGKILLGGDFTTINSQPRSMLARLENDPASQTLSIVPGGTAVRWDRSGSAPEVEQVTFEGTANGGVTWTLLGAGTRVTGGWELTGLSLAANSPLRARGRTVGGRQSGSSGLMEQTINVPEIEVESPVGTGLTSQVSTVDFGPVTSGNSLTKTFTIRSTGNGTLSGLAVSKTGDGIPPDFTIGALGTTTLAPNASTTFTVTFAPIAPGVRDATLLIASNDGDENPFRINLTGTQATASEAWRLTWFGSTANTGDGADLNDPDGDGIVNLMEFATGSSPLAYTPPVGQLVKNGSLLEFTYSRTYAAQEDLSYELEASVTLIGTWTKIGMTTTILSDDGNTQLVKVTTPAGTLGKRFVRLRVTRL